MKTIINIFIAMALSLASSIGVTTALLLFFMGLVNIFRLNHNGNCYWVFNVCIVAFFATLLLSFAYFLGNLK